MSTHSTHSLHFPRFRRLWKPVAVTGAGGAAIAVWFDEILLFGEEILALVSLPILAGTIFLLDIFIFRSCKPCREDMDPLNNKGANK